jgi:uncharacterized protein (DUF39 family)
MKNSSFQFILITLLVITTIILTLINQFVLSDLSTEDCEIDCKRIRYIDSSYLEDVGAAFNCGDHHSSKTDVDFDEAECIAFKSGAPVISKSSKRKACRACKEICEKNDSFSIDNYHYDL